MDAQVVTMALCERDPIWWCNNFGWTFDPRPDPGEPSDLPFVLFPAQAECFKWMIELLRDGEEGILEKSREMGATWIYTAFMLHGWLFSRSGFVAGVGSRKLDLVDKLEDMGAIMPKFRYMYRRLPYWMMPKGFVPKLHDNHCRIVNPDNGSSIVGEGGDDIGRGNRVSVYGVDEAAHLEHPEAVDRSLSATARSVIWISTPKGASNPFALKRKSGRYQVFTLHWKSDPRKNHFIAYDRTTGERIGEGAGESVGFPGARVVYPYYEKFVEKYEHDPVVVAQELDIDYTASVEGICIPHKWVEAAVEFDIPGIENGFKRGGLDVSAGGSAWHAFCVRYGNRIMLIDRWKGSGEETDPTTMAYTVGNRVRSEFPELEHIFYDSVGVGAGIGGAFRLTGPHRFRWSGVNVGIPPDASTVWPDRRTSKEMFRDLKAELWWKLRARFLKTYLQRYEGRSFPASELISIPRRHTLISQLSDVKIFETEGGLLRLESKDQLSKRNIPSPDEADALALTEMRRPSQAISAAGGGPGRGLIGGTPHDIPIHGNSNPF